MKGLLRASEAKNILLQSGLEQLQLKQIWDLCDRSTDPSGQGTGKAFLKRNEWMVCLHLITYSKKGWPLPKVLPPELENFLSNYSQSRLMSESGIGSNSYINPNAPSMSNSYHNSTSLTNKEPLSYNQSTVIGDSTHITRTNTLPVMQSSIANNGPVIARYQAPVAAPVAPAQSQDLSVIMSLLERAIKGYEVLGKKYSDETETFQIESKKLSLEKQRLLEEIAAETDALIKEFDTSSQLQRDIECSVAAVSRSIQENGAASQLDRLGVTFNREESIKSSFSLLESLKGRLESGAFPISMEPLPNLASESRHHVQHSQVTTEFQPSQPHTEYSGQQYHQTHHSRGFAEEDDMFA